MNKTVTINISGIIFHIEEDAYDSLSRYLAAIKGYFSNTDGGNEIMADIEARIAELLQEKINASKQVILMADVDYVKNVMGRPEDFGGEPVKEANTGSNNEQFTHTQQKVKRKLFRNPDEKAIGGVCSGLAAYFDIDTVWVRLAMFCLIFFGGISIWVYVILWIVIPQAKTTADKLAMRGESANINNIFQSFKEEAEDVKNRFQKGSKEYSQQFYDTSAKVRSGASSALNTAFNILGRLIGLFLLFIGTVFLFAYGCSLFGFSLINDRVDFSNWKSAIIASPSVYALGIFSFVIVFGIPIFMLLYAGIKLLFKIRYSNRWMNLSLGILWFIGLMTGSYVVYSALMQFSQSTRLTEISELHGTGDTIYVKLNPATSILKELKFDNSSELDFVDKHHNSGYHFGEIDNQLSLIGYAGLDVIENQYDSVEIVIYQTAKGATKKEANENARAIHYNYRQVGNQIILDEIFSVAAGSKFRGQDLEVKLKVPKGKVVFFDKSLKYFLDDVDNTTNTWDGDMVDRRWKMTGKGLECIDCKGLKSVRDHEREDDEDEGIHGKNISIDENGIHVKGGDAEIKIDDDGIRIKTPDKEYEIKDGEEREIKKPRDHKDKTSSEENKKSA